MNRLFFTLFICFNIFLSSCQEPAEIVLPRYQPKHIHEAYKISLQEAGLAQTALGIEWIDKAEEVLNSPVPVKAPYEEEFYFLDNEVNAQSYQIEGSKGHLIKATLDQIAGDSTLVFLDAYRITTNPGGEQDYELIASADKAQRSLEFEVVENGSFIIRFQHELLRKGQFRMKIIKVPSLAFPVAGGKTHDIGSLFGVSRDAGKRTHKGIDIFARRHTPIIAPTDGFISWAGDREGSLGGKVIWMRDLSRKQTLYFAHLQDVFVAKGENVAKGDTIGSVGNSGNAITTAPHLHFGIYQEQGAVDPYDHVVTLKTRSSRILADSKLLGQSAKIKRSTKLRSLRPTSKKDILLPKNQFVKVTGRFANYLNISLPEGAEGSIFYDDISPIDRSIKKIKFASSLLLDTPNDKGIALSILKDEEVKVLASDKNYSFVETNNGLTGWVHN